MMVCARLSRRSVRSSKPKLSQTARLAARAALVLLPSPRTRMRQRQSPRWMAPPWTATPLRSMRLMKRGAAAVVVVVVGASEVAVVAAGREAAGRDAAVIAGREIG